jgi:hypothetical protein
MKFPRLEDHPRKYILLTIVLCCIMFKLYLLNSEITDDDTLPDPPLRVILPGEQFDPNYNYSGEY